MRRRCRSTGALVFLYLQSHSQEFGASTEIVGSEKQLRCRLNTAPRNTVLPSGAQRGLLYLHDKLILHDLLTSKPRCSAQPVYGVKKPPVPLKLYRACSSQSDLGVAVLRTAKLSYYISSAPLATAPQSPDLAPDCTEQHWHPFYSSNIHLLRF
ncbi:uncharacterized [Tachysurus ichikawai]